MIDLRQDLMETWRTLSRTTSRGGGRAVMFMSARTGEGASSVAASFAMVAAQRSNKGVWLVDLDLGANAQYDAFAKGKFSKVLGALGPAHAAETSESSFFSITPDLSEEQKEQDRFVVHRVGDTRLLVSRFRSDLLTDDQKIRIRTGAEYWKKVRTTADWVVIDAPALEQSAAGLAVCSQLDAVIAVVRADKTPTEDVSRLCQEIESHGGALAGVMLNRVSKEAGFVDQFAG